MSSLILIVWIDFLLYEKKSYNPVALFNVKPELCPDFVSLDIRILYHLKLFFPLTFAEWRPERSSLEFDRSNKPSLCWRQWESVCVAAAHLGFDVFSDKTLCDDINALTVTQDMSSALRVVHQSFDAADQWGVDLRLGGLVVHRLEEVQDTRQTVQIDESCHEPDGRKSQRKVKAFL